MGGYFQNVAAVEVLDMSESAKTLSTYVCAAKSLPGGLQIFSKHRSRGPGEGRERYCLSVFSYSYQLAVDR